MDLRIWQRLICGDGSDDGDNAYSGSMLYGACSPRHELKHQKHSSSKHQGA